MTLLRYLTLLCTAIAVLATQAQSTFGYTYASAGALASQYLLHASSYGASGQLIPFDIAHGIATVKVDAAGDVAWSNALAALDTTFRMSVTSSTVSQTGDGLLVGPLYASGSPGASEIGLIDLGPDGVPQWSVRIAIDSHPFAIEDFMPPLVATTANGAVQVVVRYAFEASDRITVLALTSEGELSWSKSYSFSTSPDDRCWAGAIAAPADGGSLIAGSASSDIYLIRLDESGAEVWDRRIYCGQFLEVYSAVPTSDDGFVIAGNLNDLAPEVFAMKVSSSGSIEWMKHYGDAGNTRGFWNMVTDEQGSIWAGEYYSIGTRLMQLSPDGEVEDAFTLTGMSDVSCAYPIVLRVAEDTVTAVFSRQTDCDDPHPTSATLLRFAASSLEPCHLAPNVLSAALVPGSTVLGVTTYVIDETVSVLPLPISVDPVVTSRTSVCQTTAITTPEVTDPGKLAVHPSLVATGASFTLTLPSTEMRETLLMDDLGRAVVRTVTANAHSLEVSTAGLAPGYYHIQVRSARDVLRAAVVVE
ncbi:MAG TPA: hypothetical protein PKE53_11120 [Flavobacteriales bacterium]|nr:hypothetical protein [Flavobacteriales bacterium]HMU14548.1 hypothetical protein [Flavobacteriales bacterium]HNE78951.1 hypothetical protein [Flavobacteriales bacterium]HNI03083.1 hypothetical protein [Flavobacteriales bacterium]HNK41942.1 hypothetical protein [Flavobacteriales bacterium]